MSYLNLHPPSFTTLKPYRKDKMRLKLVVAFLSLVVVNANAQALQTEISFQPAFVQSSTVSQINGYDIAHDTDLNLSKNKTIYTLYGAIFLNHLAVKGYYIFPVVTSGDGRVLQVVSDPKKKPADGFYQVSSNYTFSGNRIELAFPYRLNNLCLLEPFALYQTTTQSINITGKDYSYTDSTTNKSFGLGLQLTESLSSYDQLKAKFLATSNANMFQIKYLRTHKTGALGVGYDWLTIDNPNIKTRISGPTLEIGVRF